MLAALSAYRTGVTPVSRELLGLLILMMMTRVYGLGFNFVLNERISLILMMMTRVYGSGFNSVLGTVQGFSLCSRLISIADFDDDDELDGQDHPKPSSDHPKPTDEGLGFRV